MRRGGAGPTTTVFAYGTLRADFCETGDQWNVVDQDCEWEYATVVGYKLLQDSEKGYPFCVRTGRGADIVRGTVLRWRGAAGAEKLERCDGIEGFDADGGGLYERSIVDAIDVTGTEHRAFMYFQREAADDAKEFPDGNWLDKAADVFAEAELDSGLALVRARSGGERQARARASLTRTAKSRSRRS